MKKEDYRLPVCECLRCGHQWNPRLPEKPTICPKCKKYTWDRKEKPTRNCQLTARR